MVSGSLLPTRDPFLYSLSFTALDGIPLGSLEAAVLEAVEQVRDGGVDPAEMARAKRQLRARLVFENDSVTNIAHQLGYFETVVGPDFFPSLQKRIDAVTPEQVLDVARRRFGSAARTTGWFVPVDGARAAQPAGLIGSTEAVG
jgi:zinc protease